MRSLCTPGVNVKSGVWASSSGGLPADRPLIDSLNKTHTGDNIGQLAEAAQPSPTSAHSSRADA